MKIKLSIISLIGISIFPIHSIAWDEGVSIELKGAESGLITITKIKDFDLIEAYMDPACNYFNNMKLDYIFDPTTKTTSYKLNSVEKYPIQICLDKNYTKVKNGLEFLSKDISMTIYSIDGEEGDSLSITVSFKTFLQGPNGGYINMYYSTYNVYCYDSNDELMISGKSIKNGNSVSVTLSTPPMNCYIFLSGFDFSFYGSGSYSYDYPVTISFDY